MSATGVLGKAQPAEQRIAVATDPRAGIVGLGLACGFMGKAVPRPLMREGRRIS